VFGALVRGEAKLPAAPTLPAAVAARWGGRAGAIAAGLAEPPPLDLSLRDPATTAEWAGRLGGTSLASGHVRLPRGTAVADLAGLADGAWWVQDLAASLPARLLGAGRERRVLDLCAAPGGKTLQLAAAGAHVIAVDKSDARLNRLRENLARTKLEAEVVAADALAYRPSEPFDAVLLDAPCASTGTLRRHPDVAWLRRPTDVRALAELQAKLLAAAAALLKRGAPLVYAVCSLEPEEGEGVVTDALKNGWKRDPLRAGDVPGADEFITDAGDLRTLPAHWPEFGGLDGFYAARLVR
jgi:16S rRNA (cytosine967-C5)-methyltransferase